MFNVYALLLDNAPLLHPWILVVQKSKPVSNDNNKSY